MSATNPLLKKQAVRELQTLPDNLVQEVLDFIGYLQMKYQGVTGPHPENPAGKEWLATFGTWEDEREAEEIIAEIYDSRTTSSEERRW